MSRHRRCFWRMASLRSRQRCDEILPKLQSQLPGRRQLLPPRELRHPQRPPAAADGGRRSARVAPGAAGASVTTTARVASSWARAWVAAAPVRSTGPRTARPAPRWPTRSSTRTCCPTRRRWPGPNAS
jgi:hypothetical protein